MAEKEHDLRNPAPVAPQAPGETLPAIPSAPPIALNQGVPGQDYVSMPGVSPITPQSFPGGLPQAAAAIGGAVGAPAQAAPIMLDPVEVNAPLPPLRGQPPVAGAAPPGNAPTAPAPAGQSADGSINFGTTPLSPRAGIQADATTYGNMASALGRAGEAQRQGKSDEAAVHLNYAQSLEKDLANSQESWNKAVAVVKAKEAAADAEFQKVKNMSIDPDRIWARRGTAGSILTAISVGLGSMGSGMTKGASGNPGLELLNRAIENDISAQKENIKNHWETVKHMYGLADSAANREIVNQNFMSSIRLVAYKQVESKLQGIKANTDSAVVKAAADKQIEDMRLINDNNRKQLYASEAAIQAAAGARMENIAKERRATVTNLAEKFVASGMDPDQAVQRAHKTADELYPMTAGTVHQSPGQAYEGRARKTGKFLGDVSKLPDEQAVALITKTFGVDQEKAKTIVYETRSGKNIGANTLNLLGAVGIKDPYSAVTNSAGEINKKDQPRAVIDPTSNKPVLMPDAESAHKYREKAAQIFGGRRQIARLKELRDKHGGGYSELLNSDDAKEAELLTNQLAGTVNAMGNAGTLNAGEFPRAKASLPNTSGFTNWITGANPDKQLDTLDEILRDSDISNFQAYGGQAYKAPEPKVKADEAGAPKSYDSGGPKKQGNAFQQPPVAAPAGKVKPPQLGAPPRTSIYQGKQR